MANISRVINMSSVDRKDLEVARTEIEFIVNDHKSKPLHERATLRKTLTGIERLLAKYEDAG